MVVHRSLTDELCWWMAQRQTLPTDGVSSLLSNALLGSLLPCPSGANGDKANKSWVDNPLPRRESEIDL